jgi:hypothetical protein
MKRSTIHVIKKTDRVYEWAKPRDVQGEKNVHHIRKTVILPLYQPSEKSDGGAGLILCNPHRDGDGAPDLRAGTA